MATKNKKQKFVFVLGERYVAEQYSYCGAMYWGNNRGYLGWNIYHTLTFKRNSGCSIVKFVLAIAPEDFNELQKSIDIAPNHSAILPLEV